jgi:hypothetical protein
MGLDFIATILSRIGFEGFGGSNIYLAVLTLYLSNRGFEAAMWLGRKRNRNRALQK